MKILVSSEKVYVDKNRFKILDYLKYQNFKII